MSKKNNQARAQTNQAHTQTNQAQTQTNQAQTQTNQTQTQTNQTQTQTNQTQTQTNCCSECAILGVIDGITLALFLTIPLAGIVANCAIQDQLGSCIAIIISYTIILCVLLICATCFAIHYMNYRYHCIQETQKLKRRKELFGQNDQKNAPSENSGSSDSDTSGE